MDGDPRFAAAAGGAARYLGDLAGLEAPEASQLQSAVIAACQKWFALLDGAHPRLRVVFAVFADRIEVELSVDGLAEAAKIPEFPSAMDGVDGVEMHTRDGVPVACLTKYLPGTQ